MGSSPLRMLCCLALLFVALLPSSVYSQKPDRSFGTVRTDTLRFSDASVQVTAAMNNLYLGASADSENTNTWDKFPMGVLPYAMVVDSVKFLCSYFSPPNFTPAIYYGQDITASGAPLGSYESITSSYVTSSVGNGVTVPAGDAVWVVWNPINTTPHRWAVIVWGHRREQKEIGR